MTTWGNPPLGTTRFTKNVTQSYVVIIHSTDARMYLDGHCDLTLP